MKSGCSIVVPVHAMDGKFDNLKYWLSEVDSSFFEIIFVEDAQHPSSELNQIIDNHNHLDLQHKTLSVGNPGSARNIGLEKASKEWVVFWDADDIGRPSSVKEVIESLKDTPDAVICNFQTKKWNFPEVTFSENNHHFSLSGIPNKPGLWRIIFRRESLKKLSFPSLSMGEDQYFIANFLATSPRVEFSNLCTYEYFIDVPRQLTSMNFRKLDLHDCRALFEALENSSPYISVVSEMHLRVILSALKYLPPKKKISTIFSLLRYFSKGPFFSKCQNLGRVLIN